MMAQEKQEAAASRINTAIDIGFEVLTSVQMLGGAAARAGKRIVGNKLSKIPFYDAGALGKVGVTTILMGNVGWKPLPLVDDAAVEHRKIDRSFVNVDGWNGEQVERKDDDIGQHAGAQGA